MDKRTRELPEVGGMDFLEKQPTCSGSPEWAPLGQERRVLLTQALPPDLQGILCGKQGLGEADEDLGPGEEGGRAAAMSL